MAVAVLAIGLFGIAVAQGPDKKARKKEEKKEIYTRPKPTRPIRPTIPNVNRYQSDKVFLEQADSLYKPLVYSERQYQVVKGNVKFRQGGMMMYCDSAYYFAEENSMDAFGHVRMVQGDTLFVYADKLFYNGDTRFAMLRCGASERTVRLKNRNVTLTTDSLDYNLDTDLGWYQYGGRINDGVNTLTSIYGQYCPSTKEAEFYHDVKLENNQDDFTMLTDTLFYNTDTHIASIVSPTRIFTPTDSILTTSGEYNTQTDYALLNQRSTIFHRDSIGRLTTLEGDSIIYDRASRISRAYMFRDLKKHGRPMVITDTARKAVLIGGFGEYNDSTRSAFATDYPLMIEYSRGDSLFLRADTIYSELVAVKVWPKAIADSLAAIERKVKAAPKGGVASSESQPGAAPPASSGNIASPPTQDSTSTPPLRLDSALLQNREFHIAKAYHRARFFRPDLQGVADSMTFIEQDSMLYMNIKPIVWSGERQVYGNVINVHFNDSTVDKAILPDYGMMGQHIAEDFYNQLTGKVMKAYLENEQLKRLEVDGNVQAIFLPMENDSTYNKLVQTESSHMTIDLNGQKMEKLKMWPEVTGTVIPLYIITRQQKTLPGFLWYEAIRPKREWYGGRWQWADDLGEIPEELERYFREDNNTLGRQRVSRSQSGEATFDTVPPLQTTQGASQSTQTTGAAQTTAPRKEVAP